MTTEQTQTTPDTQAPEQDLVITRYTDNVRLALLNKTLMCNIFLVRCSNEKVRVLASNGIAQLAPGLFGQQVFQIGIPDDVKSKAMERLSDIVLRAASNFLTVVIDGNFENEYQLREFAADIGVSYNLIDVLYASEVEDRVALVAKSNANGNKDFPGIDIRLDSTDAADVIKSGQSIAQHFYNVLQPLVQEQRDKAQAAAQEEANKAQALADAQNANTITDVEAKDIPAAADSSEPSVEVPEAPAPDTAGTTDTPAVEPDTTPVAPDTTPVAPDTTPVAPDTTPVSTPSV